MAWSAFGARDFSGMKRHCEEVYNYFVHNPREILKLDSPLLIGKVFQAFLRIHERDEDIQEVKAENAFLCFSQALESDKANIHDEASARLMMLLIQNQIHLKNKVEHACQNENASPYIISDMLDDGLPNDMPMAVNTKMLFTAYYLYNGIIDKNNVIKEFVNESEKSAYENVRKHVVFYCGQLRVTTSDRKKELGQIVFERICQRLRKDIDTYSNSISM